MATIIPDGNSSRVTSGVGYGECASHAELAVRGVGGGRHAREARHPPNNSTAWGIIIYPRCSAVSLRQPRNVRIQPIVTTVLVASSAGSPYCV